MTHEEVEPYLAVIRPRDREGVAAEIERSQTEPQEFGRFVIEVDGQPAGLMGFQVANRRSRIADLGSLAVHPSFRGRRVADEAARLFQRHLLDRSRLPPAPARDLRVQRTSHDARGAGRLRARGRCAARPTTAAVSGVDGVIYGLVREDLEA